MRGSTARVNWAVVASVQILGVVAFVVAMGTSVPWDIALVDMVEPPAPDAIDLIVALFLAVAVAGATSLGCAVLAHRVPEVEDRAEDRLIHLSWRSPFESHWWVGIFPGLVAAWAWLIENDLSAITGGAGATVLFAGIVVVFLLTRIQRKPSRLVIGDRLLLVDDLVVRRSAITSVVGGRFERELVLQRKDERPIRLSMSSNARATRQLVFDLLSGNEAPVEQTRLQRDPRGTWAGWLGLLAAWVIVLPVLWLVPFGILSFLGIVVDTVVVMLLAPSVSSTLFGLLVAHGPQPALVRLPDRVVFRPRREGRMGASILHGLASWWVTVGAFFMFFHLSPQLGTQAVSGWAGVGVVLFGLLGAHQWSRRQFAELSYDATGVRLAGRTNVRIPWSELVYVRHRRGAFPALFLHRADGQVFHFAAGGAPVGEVERVCADLTRRHLPHEPASEEDRRVMQQVRVLPVRS